MKFGWPISIVFHGILAAGGLIAFSVPPAITSEGYVVPVEILTLDDVTNIKAAVKAAKPRDITPSETPMQLETPMDNAQEQGEAKDRTTSEITPPPAQTPAKDAEQVADAPKPEKPVFDLDTMSVLIDKARETQPEINQQQALQSEVNFYEYAQTARAGAGLGTDLTMSELDALQTAMYKCWRIPLDAKNPEDLVIRVRVSLRSDGQVQSAELLDRAAISSSSNPYMDIAAQRAVNAISKCAPYDFLPLEKYDRWKDMTLRFKPEI